MLEQRGRVDEDVEQEHQPGEVATEVARAKYQADRDVDGAGLPAAARQEDGRRPGNSGNTYSNDLSESPAAPHPPPLRG